MLARLTRMVVVLLTRPMATVADVLALAHDGVEVVVGGGRRAVDPPP